MVSSQTGHITNPIKSCWVACSLLLLVLSRSCSNLIGYLLGGLHSYWSDENFVERCNWSRAVCSKLLLAILNWAASVSSFFNKPILVKALDRPIKTHFFSHVVLHRPIKFQDFSHVWRFVQWAACSRQRNTQAVLSAGLLVEFACRTTGV